MIKVDFYPDFQTYSDNLVLTDYLTNLHASTKTDDPLRAYYMGKLPNNKCRSLLWKDLKIVGTGDDKPNMTISLEADENRAMNWGYCLNDNVTPSRMYWTNSNEYAWSCKLINSMQAYCLTTGGNVQLTFHLFVFTDYTLDSGATIKGAGIHREYSPQLTSTEYVNWMENGTDLELTFRDYGTITIKSQSCNENGIWELGDNKYIILSQIANDCEAYYSGMDSLSYINPFYCTTARSDNRFHALSNLQRWLPLYYRIRFTQDFSDVRLYSYSTVYTASGTGVGIVSKSRDIAVSAEALDYARRQSENTYTMFGDKQTIMKTVLPETIDGKTFYQPEITYNIMPNDAYITYCLINKAKNGFANSSRTYTTAHTVGMFDSSNVPTGKRSFVTTYPALEPSLQKWQRYGYNINDDEYDPTIPPSPGGDDPGSDDPVETPLITGDDQQLQPNRTLGAPLEFITPYLITPPILTIFGRTLWTSLANYDPQDPTSVDVFKNFFAILNEEVTGSLDIGSMLSFIVSVRQYPFNVASLNIIQSAGNTISFGTGKVPINCGSAAVVYRLTSTIGLLDCGSLTIADYKDFKLYNDFRDYLNASVSAYLPYCGTVELNPVEVIHNTLHCYYAIDFYTGECTAYITCTDGNHEWISAIKNGIIGVLLPITATNSGQVSARHLSDNAKDSSLIASAVGSMFGAIGNIATGNVMGAASNLTGLAQIGASQQMLQAERQGRSAVMSPSLSGGSGAAAFFQPSCASVLVRRGTYARHKIANYPQSCAYPSTTSGILSSFSGYTECYNVDVDGINCTEEERAAIKTILETGVYL